MGLCPECRKLAEHGDKVKKMKSDEEGERICDRCGRKY